MSALPAAARIYVIAVMALGGLSLSWTLTTLTIGRPAQFVALLLLACIASIFKFTVPLPRSVASAPLSMSLSFTVNFTALLLLGPENGTLVAVIAAWSQCTFNVKSRNPWFRTLFNMSALALTMRATELAFVALGGTYGAWSLPNEVMAIVGAAAAYYVVNSGLVAAAVSLNSRLPFSRFWVGNFVQGWISHMFGAGLAALAAVALGRTVYWVAPLVGLTLVLAYRTYRAYMERMDRQQRAVQAISDLHLATVEALALAIDAKDSASRLHLRRLQRHGALLARASGLEDAEVQAVETAAMLHDIGMLAIPQHILSKSGPLTDDEQRKLRVHPQVGADIVRSVPFPAPVAPLIASHHERWDGRGYPAGLSGDRIPVGARIIALVDMLDGLLQGDSPLSLEQATARIVREAGHALDPALVERFRALQPEIARQEHDLLAQAGFDGTSEVETSGSAQPARGPLEHIALAHREVHELYELSQALGATLTVRDAMVSLTSRLAGLVPFTTCALFVREGDTGRTLCRAVGGRESEKYTLIATEFVEGPVAWVIDNERSLVTNLPAASPRRPAGSAPPPPLVEVLLCPLRADGQTFGAFAVYHHRRGSYGDDQRRVLEQVCDILGAAVQNSLRYERTHQAALTDGLTGLPNSRGLAAGFERALARAAHEQQPLAVLMTDLNGFKDVNDSYGHDVGDRALKEVSRVLFHAIRPSDLCARYAGDEFVILLSNCDARQAARRAEELRREIASLHFEPAPGTVVPLGISVGAAVFPDDGRTLEAMLIAADRRMYADKTSARRSPERAARDSSGAPLRSKSADSDPAAPVAVSATTSPIDDGNPPSATPDTANVG